MIKLVRKAHASADGDLSMDWLKPLMTRRKYGKEQLLFRKGGCGERDDVPRHRISVPGAWHFGYYFLRLSSERLLENNARLAAIIERDKSRLD